MKKLFIFLVSILFLAPLNLLAASKIKIVATTTTLASVTKEITGDLAQVYSVASPKRNIHFYQPTPKDVLKVKNADILVHGGLDLEVWRDPMLNAAGNPRLLGQNKFSIDVSKGIPLREVPVVVSRAEGDIHLYGNPHYVIDPGNMKIIASNIGKGLSEAFPEHRDEFLKNLDAYNQKLDAKINNWEKRMAPFKGMSVVTYHKSWIYFTERFGFKIVGELEPKPGIPPTAKHLAELIETMKEKNAKLIIKETFFENRAPEKLAGETGAKVVNLAQAVGEVKEAGDYISMIEYNVRLIEQALGGTSHE